MAGSIIIWGSVSKPHSEGITLKYLTIFLDKPLNGHFTHGQTLEHSKDCRSIKSIGLLNRLSLLYYYRRKRGGKRGYIYKGGANNSLFARILKKQLVRSNHIRLSFWTSGHPLPGYLW